MIQPESQHESPIQRARLLKRDVADCRPWIWLALMLLVGLGGYLRFNSLGYNDLNRDEFGQTLPVVRDMLETGHVFARSAGSTWWDRTLPFLSFAMSAISVAFLGDTDVALRLFPALFGTISILLFWRLARRFLPPCPALLCTSLFTLSTAHIYYSREARYYAYIVFFALVVLLLALRLADRQARRKYWAGLGIILAALLAISTHWFSVLFLTGTMVFLACHWISGWLCTPRRRRLAIGSVAAIGVLCVTLLTVSMIRGGVRSTISARSEADGPPIHPSTAMEFLSSLPQITLKKWRDMTGAHGGWTTRFSRESKGYQLLGLTVRTFSNAGNPYRPSEAPYFNETSPILAWGMTTLAVIGWLTSFRRHPHFAWLTTLWFVPALLLFWLANPEHFVAAKYIIFVLPLYLVAVTLGVDWILSRLTALRRGDAPQSMRFSVVGQSVFVAAVALLSWNAIHAARFHRNDGYKQLAERILTELPSDVVLCNLTNLPPDASWKYLGYYDGVTDSLLPRYLNMDNGSRPIHQIAGLEGWCDFVRSRPSARFLVFGVGKSPRKDPRLVQWISKHALPDNDLPHLVSIEPFLIPSPDVQWPKDPKQITLAPPGRTAIDSKGVPVRSTRPLSIKAKFAVPGPYQLRTSGIKTSGRGRAILKLAVDGKSVAREMLPDESRPQPIQLRFTIADAGTHTLRISVDKNDGPGGVDVWLDYIDLLSSYSPRKYVMSGAGVAALLINANDGNHKTWELRVGQAANKEAEWQSFFDTVSALPAGSPVIVLSRGPALSLFEGDHASIAAAFHLIGADETVLRRLRSESGLLLLGVVGADDANVEPLPNGAVRFLDKGCRFREEAEPLPWPLAIANMSGAEPIREEGADSYHLPQSYRPGVYYLPAGEMNSADAAMQSSYVEPGVAVDAQIHDRFFHGEWKRRRPVIDRCLASSDQIPGMQTVWAMPEADHEKSIADFGFSANQRILAGHRWQSLVQAPITALKEQDHLRLVMTNDAPENIEAIQFILRTSREDGIWWKLIPNTPQQTTPFECPLKSFTVNGGAKLEEIESLDIRVLPRGDDPVTIEVLDARILRKADTTSSG